MAKRFDVLLPQRDLLISRLASADSAKEQYDLYKEIRDLDRHIEQTRRPIAFKGMSNSDRCFRVA
eukprot:8336330-Alexandrium_andersonii.AAC.1